ncbi:hypothetical protein EOI87_22000 [Salmonella enterica]|nr:hypothetical protein [Salmonella enterica]
MKTLTFSSLLILLKLSHHIFTVTYRCKQRYQDGQDEKGAAKKRENILRQGYLLTWSFCVRNLTIAYTMPPLSTKTGKTRNGQPDSSVHPLRSCGIKAPSEAGVSLDMGFDAQRNENSR